MQNILLVTIINGLAIIDAIYLRKLYIRGSGGVGLLAKLSMYENFKVNVLDNRY